MRQTFGENAHCVKSEFFSIKICPIICNAPPQVFEEGSSSECVAVQMHNLQHKFLRCTLRQKATHPNTNTRVSLIQAALYYHRRTAADRRDKVGRLLELALADLKDSETIEELSQALSECEVELDNKEGQNGENPNLTQNYPKC